MNEARTCCKIDSKSTLFTCTDSLGARIRPIFHKQEHFALIICLGLTAASPSLWEAASFIQCIGTLAIYIIQLISTQLLPSKYVSSKIASQLIQNSEFTHVYYEMSSLVILPVSMQLSQHYNSSQDYQTPQFTVTIKDNVFSGFSNCGSLFSNDLDLYLPLTSNYPNPSFSSYEYRLPVARYRKLIQDYYYKNYALWTWINQQVRIEAEPQYGEVVDELEKPSQYKQAFIITGNTFSNFNQLKRRATDTVLERKESRSILVNNERMRNLGMVIDLFDNFKIPMYIHVESNTFQNTNQHLGAWNESQPGFDHCMRILDKGYEWLQASILTPSLLDDQYYQQTHLINVKGNNNSRILIMNNTFFNVSLAGPIIHLQERQGYATNQYLILSNTFKIIHSYINSNVITILRSNIDYSGMDSFINSNSRDWSDWELNLIRRSFMGGNILVKKNTFTEIAGCQSVSSLILVGVVNNFQSNSLNLPQEIHDNGLDSITDFNFEALSTILTDTFITSEIPNVKLKLQSTKYPESLTLHRQVAIFQQNRYINLSMGVASSMGGLEKKGGLIKLVNVVKALIEQEIFENIGGFTGEHLNDVLSQVFGTSKEKLAYNGKTELRSYENKQAIIYYNARLQAIFFTFCQHGFYAIYDSFTFNFFDSWSSNELTCSRKIEFFYKYMAY
ncbi:hypothetical protein FGO68_gene17540 [Halteria grandinella]|uniref:Uncharacterized protein n=1 Tax=Halteria grandinella TaxID=5974 RepID=A0A8J8TB74_HALGN|nr:hypothetical protein FGO68_gene17540 [Halteria grandinella]